jgi:Tol biopolymer transport system component
MDKTMKKAFLFLLLALPVQAAEVELIAVDAHRASLSSDGQLVAYESKSDVYVYDRQTGAFEKIQAPNPRRVAGGPDISSNGNLLVFHSYTTGIDVGVAPRLADIRVLNRKRQTQELLTTAYGAAAQDGEALNPRFGINGRYVLFTSNATNLLPAKKEPLRAAYLYDRYKSSVELVSKNAVGEPADRAVGDPRISQNGRYVFFKSAATNLVGKLPDTHLSSHLYRSDQLQPGVVRIDDEDRGFDEDRWATGRYAMNGDGNVVIFEGRDRKIADFDKQLGATTLFLYDASTESIRMLLPEEYTGRAYSPTLSADGRYVAFSLRPKGLMVLDRQTNELRSVADAECENIVLSADGRTIAFESEHVNFPDKKPAFQAATKPGVLNLYITQNPFSK